MPELDPDLVVGPPGGDLVSLNSVPRALRHRPALIVLGALLGVAAGFLVLATSNPTWTSTATVQVNRGLVGLDSNPLGRGEAVSAESEAKFALSDRVATLAKSNLSSTASAEQLRDRVEIQASDDANTLSVSYTAESPAAARDGANAFADAYLAARATVLEGLVERSRTTIETQSSEVAARQGDPDERSEADQSLLTSYSQQLGRLASVVVDPGVVIARAPLPRTEGALPDVAYLVIGGGVGLLLGWAAAAVREHLRSPVRTEEDLRRLGLPTMGTWVCRRDQAEAVAARLAMRLRSGEHPAFVVSEPAKHHDITPELREALIAAGVHVADPLTPLPGQASLAPSTTDRVGPAEPAEPAPDAPLPSLTPGSAGEHFDPLTHPLPRELFSVSALAADGSVQWGPSETWSFQPIARAAALASVSMQPTLQRSVPGDHPTLGIPAAGDRSRPGGAASNGNGRSAAGVVAEPARISTAPDASRSTGVVVRPVPSLLASPNGLVTAADVGAVVLVVDRGTSRRQVDTVLRDLRDGDVTVLGVILL